MIFVIVCVQLAVHLTPIHRWSLPGVPKDFQVFVKRDDMTGSTLSGNKVCNKTELTQSHKTATKYTP